tara:strand:+ start:370 stop:1062 length:693 start_codon:yes stop_codon:yes gene_type:complete
MGSQRFVRWRVWGALCLLGAWGSSIAAPVATWLTPDGTSVQVGSTLRLQFALGGLGSGSGDSLGLYDLDVLYTSASLRFAGGSFSINGSGNPLDLPEAGSAGFLGDINNSGAGVIDVFALSGNSQSVLDTVQANNLLLFELQFEALAANAAAYVAIDLADPFLLFGSSDPLVDLRPGFTTSRVDFEIGSGSPGTVPEPSTLLLAALALGLTGAVRHITRSSARLGDASCA